MNISYIKSQFIPKNNTLKILYGILWILEPGLMACIVAYKLARNRKQ